MNPFQSRLSLTVVTWTSVLASHSFEDDSVLQARKSIAPGHEDAWEVHATVHVHSHGGNADDSDSDPLSPPDLAALPWSDLSSRLVSGADMLVDASPEKYFTDCSGVFLKPDPASRSTYDLIDKPSGLCMAAWHCGYTRCYPDPDYVYGNKTTEELVYQVYDYAYIQDNFLAWSDPSNPTWNLPHKVLFPEVAGDAVAAVRFAKEHGVEISVKNSGHSYTGASTKKDSLLLNMNKFKRYASEVTGVIECNDDEEIAADLSNQPCAFVRSRGKSGVLRVGGGENWDKTYRAVKAYNENQTEYRFHMVGGNSATVSPMGWTWSGGLAGTNSGRQFGLGVDQVVQIEAVLPNGQHVRFGPIEWEPQPEYLVPRTTAVSGVCNQNPEEPDESLWNWQSCTEHINFDDLWFAFRGGGGGTWGVVLSVHLQLHDYLPFAFVWPTEECQVHFLPHLEALKRPLTRFHLDFLLDPTSVGVSVEESNLCGRASPGYPFLWCFGEGADAYLSAYSRWIHEQNDTLASGGFNQTQIEVANRCYTDPGILRFPDFGAMGLLGNVGSPHEGHVKDDGGNTPYAGTDMMVNALVPRWWILENKDRFVELVLSSGNEASSLYASFGGNTVISHDQTESLSTAHREAGFMFIFHRLELETVPGLKDALNEWYDFTGTEFPAFVGGNHLNSGVFGPLKSDWTTPCPLSFTRRESEELCVSAQEAVWGSENLARLEAIKRDVDPNGMFNCFRCVGNKASFEAES